MALFPFSLAIQDSMPDMQVPSVAFQIGFSRVDSPSAWPVVLLISRLALDRLLPFLCCQFRYENAHLYNKQPVHNGW